MVFDMEQREKNSVTTVLFVVGGLFIAVAAVLFATTAWKSFSQGAKDITVFLVMAIGFVSSFLVRRKEKLQKTATVLYYLATVFLGLTVYALFAHYLMPDSVMEMGSLYSGAINCFPVFMAHVSMAVAAGISFFMFRGTLDMVLLVLLVDMSLFWGGNNFDSYTTYLPVVLSTFGLIQLFYTVAMLKEEIWNPYADDNLHTGAAICYWFNVALYSLLVFINLDTAMVQTSKFFEAYYMDHQLQIGQILSFSVNAGMLVLMISLTYRKLCTMALRILQSLSVLLLVPAIAMPLKVIVEICTYREMKGDLLCFLCYVLCCCLLVALPRIEMLVLAASYGGMMAFVQVMVYGMYSGTNGWIGNETVYPYLSIFLIAFILVLVRCYQKDSLSLSSLLLEDNCGLLTYQEMFRYRMEACLSFVVVLVLLLLYYCTEQSITFGVSVLIASGMLFAACHARGAGDARSILLTIALFFAELAFFTQNFFTIPEELRVEWRILLLALGLIAVCHIFREKRDIELVRFVSFCGLIGIQLLYNICFGELYNALILGIVGIVILLYGVFANDKSYVLLAAVTLICLVAYLTKSFWLSISWWVYLLVAGIVLIGLAIKKEREG